ncbi:MAG: hypothetical protein NTY57_03520 [Solirubrobacterales bacterium]|nr:hypothetical protein [Solirubrobacterales bacterium]
MTTKLATKRDIPPSDPKLLADWLAPRPGETYEAWSKRFDKAEKRLEDERRPAANRPRQTRTRGSQPKRRAA